MSIPYAVFVARAMRSILRDVLERLISHGIHEPNAIYIQFLKNHPAVEMPDWTRQRLDAETTIVLQHDFTGLSVTETGFSVTLKFGGIPARLHIPFTAVLAFSDPGANVRFAVPASDEAASPVAAEPALETAVATVSEAPVGDKQPDGNIVSLASFRK